MGHVTPCPRGTAVPSSARVPENVLERRFHDAARDLKGRAASGPAVSPRRFEISMLSARRIGGRGLTGTLLVWLGLLAAGVACQSEDPDSACAPGESAACSCEDGTRGAQSCREDGSGFEACV